MNAGQFVVALFTLGIACWLVWICWQETEKEVRAWNSELERPLYPTASTPPCDCSECSKNRAFLMERERARRIAEQDHVDAWEAELQA